MNWFKDLNYFTKICLIGGFSLILYGYLSRFFSIFFFWESQSIGFGLLLFGIIGFLNNIIKKQKARHKSTILHKIGIGLIVFTMMVSLVIWIFVPRTNAYTASIGFINENEDLKAEIGEIEQIVFIPIGGMGMSSGAKGEEGNASFTFIVKGEKAYTDLTLHSYTTYEEEDWTIYKVE